MLPERTELDFIHLARHYLRAHALWHSMVRLFRCQGLGARSEHVPGLTR